MGKFRDAEIGFLCSMNGEIRYIRFQVTGIKDLFIFSADQVGETAFEMFCGNCPDLKVAVFEDHTFRDRVVKYRSIFCRRISQTEQIVYRLFSLFFGQKTVDVLLMFGFVFEQKKKISPVIQMHVADKNMREPAEIKASADKQRGDGSAAVEEVTGCAAFKQDR